MKYLIFSTPMVRVLLAGRKSMTRRLVKPQPPAGWSKPPVWVDTEGYWHSGNGSHIGTRTDMRSPLRVGDIFGVRETFSPCACSACEAAYPKQPNPTCIQQAPHRVTYRAERPLDLDTTWRPSIHMPAWAVRLFYRVTEVKVERVQDISEADAIAEGVEKEPLMPVNGARQPWKRYDEQACAATSAVHSFYTLWKSINGHESWEANPWVWCYRFERCERPTP